MIEEPKVGMRVRVGDRFDAWERYSGGDSGTIKKVELDKIHEVDVDGKGCTYIQEHKLTEIKEEAMKKGDLVTVADGSKAVCIVGNIEYLSINVPSRHFKVISIINEGVECRDGSEAHNIVIESTVSNNIYLHSKKFCKLVEPVIKEVTMADLESHYGCKVKVVK
jgi:hypothetical protein